MLSQSSFSWEKARLPIISFKVFVPIDSRIRFLTAMQDFARSKSFVTKVRVIHPSLPQFGVDFWNDDIAVMGENIFIPTVFDFGIYIDQTKAGAKEAARGMADEIKQAVRDIDGVTVTITSQ